MNQLIYGLYLTLLFFEIKCKVINANCTSQTLEKLCNDESDYLEMTKKRCCWVEKNFIGENRAKENNCIELDFTEEAINKKIEDDSKLYENIKVLCQSNLSTISIIPIIILMLTLI